jgi:hypothetical protein
MSLNRTLQSLKLATLLGGIVGLGFGCIINLEPLEPCDSGSNNKLDSNGECECRIGYEWCDPADQSNLNCCDDDIGGTNTSTSGPGDGDGDPTGDGDPDTGDGDGDPAGDGDGDGDGDCAPGELPPESCTGDEEGFYWCTNSEAMGPGCSEFYICENGAWTENPGFMDESCGFDGFDFAYGCVDDGSSVIFECGDGSGAACNDADPAYCVNEDEIGYCLWNKETWDSCQLFCEEVGIGGQTYEYGECDASVPDDIACFCCDSGDEGCPLP